MPRMSLGHRLWRSMALLILLDRITPALVLNLPQAPNVTERTIINAKNCKRHQCQVKAFDARDPDSAWACGPDESVQKILNNTLYDDSYTLILDTGEGYSKYLYCHSCEGIFTPLSLYIKRVQINLGHALFEIRHAHPFVDPYDPKKSARVRLNAVLYMIRNLLCLFITPLTVVANIINVRVLYSMLKDAGGSALYYHLFELVTDVLSTVTYACGEQYFFWVQHERSSVCATHRFSFPLQTGWTMLEVFNWYNQMFLMLLIRDRHHALGDPLIYQALDHKKIAMTNFFLVIFGSLVYYLPLILNFNFAPLKWSIAGQFGIDTGPSDYFIVAFYSMAPSLLVLLQIYYSWKTHQSYKSFVSSSANSWISSSQKEEKKKQEKQKKQLLLGTVTLNISVWVVNGFSTIYGNPRVDEILKTFDWYGYSKGILYTGRTLAHFANSTLCVLLHMCFCKTYRRAFKAAILKR